MTTLRLDAKEVLVPVYVVRKQVDPDATIVATVDDLAPSDFHLYEDGKEVPLASATLRDVQSWTVPDNGLVHCENTIAAEGIWGEQDHQLSGECGILRNAPMWTEYHNYGPLTTGGHAYLLSFVPSTEEHGCHKLKVKVDRPKLSIRSREEFCSESSPADPLAGTDFEMRAEKDLQSGKVGGIPLRGQIGVVPRGFGTSLVDVILEFPPSATQATWDGAGLTSSLGIVGLVRRKDGTVLSRFSDPSAVMPGFSGFYLGGIVHPPFPPLPANFIARDAPVRYERQFDLVSGESEFDIILVNAKHFGTISLPVITEPLDDSKASLSTIILCRHFHKPEEAIGEAAHRPKSFVPLVSKGLEYSPTGDLQFHKSDRLIAWFQIAMPPQGAASAAAPHFRLTVVNLENNQIAVDSGIQDAAPYQQTGEPVYAIAKEIGHLDKIPTGSYRIEVQAITMQGNTISSSSAALTIE